MKIKFFKILKTSNFIKINISNSYNHQMLFVDYKNFIKLKIKIIIKLLLYIFKFLIFFRFKSKIFNLT